jgi:hypothetical protein
VHKEDGGIQIECIKNQESIGNCDISIVNKTAFIELFSFDTVEQQEQFAMFLMGYALQLVKSEVEIVKGFPVPFFESLSTVHEKKKEHMIELYRQFGFQQQKHAYVLHFI